MKKTTTYIEEIHTCEECGEEFDDWATCDKCNKVIEEDEYYCDGEGLHYCLKCGKKKR